jgi:putative spermidine/putrescine transport system permease protein
MIRRSQRWLLALLALWVLTPVLVLVLRALTQSWRYPQLLPDAADLLPSLPTAAIGRLASAMGTSLWLALATGSVSTLLGFAIARVVARATRSLQRLTTALALFCVVAPPIALGAGLQVAVLGIGLGGTLTGVFLAHLVAATGYLTLFAGGVFASFDFSLDDEARTLGASRRQVLSRVTIPLLKQRLAEAGVLGGLISWGQLAITLLIGGGVVRTLPVELLSLVRAGDDRLGALAALVLSVPPMLAIAALRIGTRRTGPSL